MKQKPNQRMASKLAKAASAKNIGKKKKVIVPLYPPGLPLSDIWYTYADLILMITVQRKVTYRYIQKGILRAHASGGTVRFSKVYVDLMFENAGQNLRGLDSRCGKPANPIAKAK